MVYHSSHNIDPIRDWVPSSPDRCRTLEIVTKRWIGTPYAINQQVRGAGADCVTFVASYLDEIAGEELQNVPLHCLRPSLETSQELLIELIRAYDCMHTTQGIVTAGDILVVFVKQRPIHAAVAAIQPWQIIHCVQELGVVQTTLPPGWHSMTRIYRPTRWVHMPEGEE